MTVIQSTFHGNAFASEEGLEDLNAYRPGGFHPVSLRELYKHGRYQIIHKLGYGFFSTVWLARDRARQRYVAMKIMRADIPNDLLDRQKMVLHSLRNHKTHEKERGSVSIVDDDFDIDGPNGKHWCLVSKAMGCDLDSMKEAYSGWSRRSLPLADTLSMISQLVQGMAYIHSCGVVHAGTPPPLPEPKSHEIDGRHR